MNFAIKTNKLVRIFKIRGAKMKEDKILAALKDVDLELQTGEMFVLLGPNSADRTALIKILTTLLAASSGKAWVAGFDVLAEPEQVRPRINMVSGGESSGYGLLTVYEKLLMFSQFSGFLSKEVNRCIKHLLDIVGMGDRLNNKSLDLSTGLRQKMNIVRGFLTDQRTSFSMSRHWVWIEEPREMYVVSTSDGLTMMSSVQCY